MRKSGEDKVAICKEPFWSASTAVLEGQSPTIRTAKLRHQNPARDTALQPDAPARVQLGSMFSAGFLLELLDRADAVAVCAQISEVDPGEECWRSQIGCLSSVQSRSMNLLILLRPYSQTMWVCPNLQFRRRYGGAMRRSWSRVGTELNVGTAPTSRARLSVVVVGLIEVEIGPQCV